MKSTLLESVNTRFTEIYSDPLHFIATVLDPRYKDHYLDVGIKQRTRNDPGRDGCGQPAQRRTGAQRRRRAKRTRLSAPDVGHAPSLSDMFNEILQESAPNNR